MLQEINKKLAILKFLGVLVGRTINSIKEACLALSKAASNMGLTINEEKTKFTQVTSKPIMTSELIV